MDLNYYAMDSEQILDLIRRLPEFNKGEQVEIGRTVGYWGKIKANSFPFKEVKRITDTMSGDDEVVKSLNPVAFGNWPDGSFGKEFIHRLLIFNDDDRLNQEEVLRSTPISLINKVLPFFAPYFIKDWNASSLNFFLEKKSKRCVRNFIRILKKNSGKDGKGYYLAYLIKKKFKLKYPFVSLKKIPYFKKTRKLNSRESYYYYRNARLFNRSMNWSIDQVEKTYHDLNKGNLEFLSGQFMVYRLEFFRSWRKSPNRQLTHGGTSMFTSSEDLDSIEKRWTSWVEEYNNRFKDIVAVLWDDFYINNQLFKRGKFTTRRYLVKQWARVPKSKI